MVSKEDYLLKWGINFVENFTDGRIKKGDKTKNIPPRITIDADMGQTAILTEQGIKTKLNKLAVIKKKKTKLQPPPRIKLKSPTFAFTQAQAILLNELDDSGKDSVISYEEPENTTITTMTEYIVIDPGNDKHKNYGYIFLDEHVKVSNPHFYNFRPDRYIKPQAVKEISKQNQETLIGKVKSQDPQEKTVILNSAPPIQRRNLHFKGCWDAKENFPRLRKGTGKVGDFYVVSIPHGEWAQCDIVVFDECSETWKKFNVEGNSIC